ncbi:hypothetical protein BGZ54_004786 [Gamsiella multidivaricata]|nr:hypothetical protein BGZ54_004786 [Gamsiella multidivaricata]
MPNRRRKRFSYQSTVAPFFQQFDSREVTTVSVVSVAPPQLPSVSRPLNATTASGSRSVQSDSVQEQQLTSKSIAILPKEGGHTPHEYSSSRFGTEELGQDVPNYLNFVSDPAATSKSQASPSNPSESFHATNLDNPRSFISGTDIDTAPADPDMAEVDTTSTMQHIMGNIRATTSAAYMSPKRSLTNSSLASSNGSVFSTATMPLADSSMSIQSHQSESSMLSAAMTASGLPSMDMMMDHVDRRLALDSQAQLVDNAHVGMAHVSFVDKHLIAEPCSAAIETWVN